MEDRSSAFSGSTGTGGYETPDEEESPTTSRTVRFASEVQEHEHDAGRDRVSDVDIDKKRFMLIKRPKLGQGIAARVFRRYPRCYAFWIGMVFPLWFLVLLSMLGGRLLGDLEFDTEVAGNNEAMRNRLMAKTYDQAVSDTVSFAPQVCYTLFKQNISVSNLTSYWSEILDQQDSLLDYLDLRQEELVGVDDMIDNVTEFSSYLGECGRVADNFTNNIQQIFFGDFEISFSGSTKLTFSWSRCVNVTDPSRYNHIFQPRLSHIYAARPENQSKTFSTAWHEDQQRLRIQYLQQYRADNVSNARLKAFNASIFEASAEHTCAVNVPATAWFWFTVMTTVGYGNQAPVTLWGRVLIFTFGFYSILMFAGVLTAAGVVTSLLVNDFAIRLRLRLLANKVVMMIVWGLLWVGWLAFMSAHAIEWTRWRLEEQMSWEDGMWFAFISTTTVGLGDFYPTPEVMFTSDILIFSLSFLLGFVLLSAFLTEMALSMGYFFPDLGEELAKRLKYVGISPFEGCLHGPRSDFDEAERPEDSPLSCQGSMLGKEPEVPALPEQPPHLQPLRKDSDFNGSVMSGSFAYYGPEVDVDELKAKTDM
ncbi:expressed unknown protein [Seminavis robusta]|uniref:Potassium channel domain-containing protein n=1 Tax=Seminavis robusta TaxID=568900 RepID=A0A9N8ERE2_9STRA|nr:expressed unknown protein [Seminavis robusta]|eukprot:Sro1671_g290030.1 n/a (591) ;mRNA; r:4905-6762